MRGGLDTELGNTTVAHTRQHTHTFEVGPAKPFVPVCEDGCPHEDVRLGKLGGGGRYVLEEREVQTLQVRTIYLNIY